MSNRVANLALTIAALAAAGLGACATRPPAQAAAAAATRIQSMEDAALARQQAAVIPANGMLPIDDVVGLTVLEVVVAKAAGRKGASVTADDGSELVLVTYKLTNVTPQRQSVPDWNKLMLVDPKGQTYMPDTDRTAKLAASCAECAQVGAPVGPSGGEVRGHAVFQLPAGTFNAKTWAASWRQDEAAKIHLPDTQTASTHASAAPAANVGPARPKVSCQSASAPGCASL